MYKVEYTLCSSVMHRDRRRHIFESLSDAAYFIDGIIFLKDVEAVYLEKLDYDHCEFHEDGTILDT